jgi:SAM-dependent methyltransferase
VSTSAINPEYVTLTTRARPAIDDVYNNTLSAYAISAAWELGLIDRMGTASEPVNLSAFAAEHDLHAPSLKAIVRGLALVGAVVFCENSDAAARGPNFSDVVAKKGYFYWLTRGCGEMFAAMPELVRNEARVGGFVKRNYQAIGLAARDAGFSIVDPVFYQLVADRGLTFGADLGCGSGERLIRLAQRAQDFRGVGVDIADGALDLARSSVAAAGLDDRVRVVRGDAANMAFQPEFAEVDFVCSFMMGHDLWPRAACLASLKAIESAFPSARDFILCDTYRSDLDATESYPIFTLGFETAHAVMGQTIPSMAEWLDVFAEAGWEMSFVQEFELPPYTALMHLRRGH